MSKLDTFNCNTEWDLHFYTSVPWTLSSACSDHFSVLLAYDSVPMRPRSLRFEHFWTCNLGFKEIV
jgi:hypothetical protein